MTVSYINHITLPEHKYHNLRISVTNVEVVYAAILQSIKKKHSHGI